MNDGEKVDPNINPSNNQGIANGLSSTFGATIDTLKQGINNGFSGTLGIITAPLKGIKAAAKEGLIETVKTSKEVVGVITEVITEKNIDAIISFMDRSFRKIVHLANESNNKLDTDIPKIKKFVYNVLSILYSPSFISNDLLFHSVYERLIKILSVIPNLETGELQHIMNLYKKTIDDGLIDTQTRNKLDIKVVAALNDAFDRYEKQTKINLAMAKADDVNGPLHNITRSGGKKTGLVRTRKNFIQSKTNNKLDLRIPKSMDSRRVKYIKQLKKTIKKTLYKYHSLHKGINKRLVPHNNRRHKSYRNRTRRR